MDRFVLGTRASMFWLLFSATLSALDHYFWVTGDLRIEQSQHPRGTQSPPAEELLIRKKTRGRSHSCAATNQRCPEGGGRPAARRPEDPGPLQTPEEAAGPGVRWDPFRPRRGAPSPWAATTPGLLACRRPQLRSGPPGPESPARRPAIQPARTLGPHQVDVGEAGEHEVLEELAADAARAHHQHPSPCHSLSQLPGQSPRQCHGGTTTSRGGGGGGRTEPRPEAGGGRATQLPLLRTAAARWRRRGGVGGPLLGLGSEQDFMHHRR